MIVEKDVEKLYPIALTRPAFDILIGGYTLYSMIKEHFPNAKIGYKVRDYISESVKIKNEKLSENVIIIDASAVPSLKNMKNIEGELDLIEYPHQIIIWNKKLCKENLELKSKSFKELKKGVSTGKDVVISENVVFDTEEGNVVLDDGCKILPFSYIKGPVYVGKNTVIKDHASIKDNVAIGNVCKIGGEVEGSVIMDYSNKQHHGFLGNSFVGSWVNLGAGTTNSDLKNTYGKIKVIDGKGNKVDTGEQILGCVIGDNTKTAINTSIFTGKVIGVNAYLYGNITEDIPSFMNLTKGIGTENSEFLLEKAIDVQKIVMARRKIEQKEYDKNILKNVSEMTKDKRDMFLRT